jgi:hypothetical protein
MKNMILSSLIGSVILFFNAGQVFAFDQKDIL